MPLYPDIKSPDIEACSTYDSISGLNIRTASISGHTLISRQLISVLLDIWISSLTQYPESGNQGKTVYLDITQKSNLFLMADRI